MTPAAVICKGLVRGYQLFVRPVLPPACRFTPSCSHYAIEAIERFGAARGSWLAVCRVGRCHPWGGCGHDPVPELPAKTHSSPERAPLRTTAHPH